MQVLLHVHIATAREIRVLVTDPGGTVGERAVGVLGAVDEAEEVAVVEEAEAVGLVDDRDRAHRTDDLDRQFEADVHRLRADVEQQITRRGRGAVPTSVECDERVQLDRPGTGEQPIPRRRTDRRHHRQVLARVAKPDRAHQSRDVAQRVVDRLFSTVVDGRDEEDRRWSERREHRLRQ